MTTIDISFPEKLEPLFRPYRYKVLKGGRGGAKSWGVARVLLLLAAQKKIRVLCGRELQKSMAESVHALLKAQIERMGLEESYPPNLTTETSIKSTTGSEFLFEGIRHNYLKIKSYEDIDICWIEEANSVPKASWDVLIPTIRKEGSEIWLTFNPDLDTDYTYVYFVKNTPPNSIVIDMSWRDNPWFPEVLHQEMMHMKATDEDNWLTVWEGRTRVTLDGAIYAKEMRELWANGRIMKVPYVPQYAVNTYFDLGWGDNTSIWFIQKIGFEYHVIDFMSNHGQTIGWYMQEMQKKGYTYGTIWLPHDAKAGEIRTGKSVQEMVASARVAQSVRVTQNLRVATGINAVRMAFPNMYFDEEKCEEGINALARYRYGKLPDGVSRSREPIHDWTSHPADALRTFGVSAQWGEGRPLDEEEVSRKNGPYEYTPRYSGAGAWMT